MSTQETTTTTTTTTSSLKTDNNYVKTPNGIIRIVEMVLCIITFLMAVSIYYIRGGAVEYIQFAAATGFLQALIYFFINLFMPSLPNYKPHGTLIEFILSAVWVMLLLSAGINAAIYARLTALIAPITAFSFFSAIAYGVGCFFLFKDWRSQGGTIPTITI